ncbi:MAG: site-specific integrase [Saprospiraceae bacterium]|nr:site-specific integrase [Candidatus Defluviibacterium haderslevense]
MSKSKYSVSIVLDTRSIKTNNAHPIKFRIIINRKSFHISAGFNVEASYWLEVKQQISTRYTLLGNVTRLNNFLQREKSRILDKLLELQESGKLDRLSFPVIKQLILQKSAETLTLHYISLIIKDLEDAKKFGNAKVYTTLLRSISDFVSKKEFPLNQINYRWLKKYEIWYLSKGNSINGLGIKLRTLRAVINQAIKTEKLTQDMYAFKDYPIKHEETRKRAISREDLIKILHFEPKTQRQTRAKDYFLISFYLMGASFVDIAMLKIKNIIQDRIEYKRQKTGKLHSIPLSKPLIEIIDKYRNGKKDNEYILNVVKSIDPKIQLKQISDELRRYNKSLKEIGKICEIESSISSYVARHSYATSAKKLGVPISVISESLGHNTEKTTQIYLDSFENDVVDKYHEMVIDL